MKNKKLDIGSAYKQRFENLEVQPNPILWHGIEKAIQKKNFFKSKKEIMIGIGAFIIASAITFFIITSHVKNPIFETSTIQSHMQNVDQQKFISNNDSLKPQSILSAKKDDSTHANIQKQTLKTNEFLSTNQKSIIAPAVEKNQITSTRIQANEADLIQEININPIEKTSMIIENNISTLEKKTVINPTGINKDVEFTKIINPKQPNDSILFHDTNINKNKNEEENDKSVLWVPSGFTPDASENNHFYVKGIHINKYEIHIYSKTRVLVYSSTDINEKWDGTYKGEALQTGVYVYAITYTDVFDVIHQKKGTITLIRQK